MQSCVRFVNVGFSGRQEGPLLYQVLAGEFVGFFFMSAFDCLAKNYSMQDGLIYNNSEHCAILK